MTVGISELPPEGMQLGGVALAGDADRGTRTTEGLSLLFTIAGITVQGPQPQIERLLVWSGLDTATCDEKVVLPDGRDAAVMELTSGGQSIRFLLPTDAVSPGQAAYLDQALPAWLARYRDPAGQTHASGAEPRAAEVGPPQSGPSAPVGPAAEPQGAAGFGAGSPAGSEPVRQGTSPSVAGVVAAGGAAGVAGAEAAAGFAAGGTADRGGVAGAASAEPPDALPGAGSPLMPPPGGNRPAAAYSTTQSSTIPSPSQHSAPQQTERPDGRADAPDRAGPPPPVTAGSLLAPAPGDPTPPTPFGQAPNQPTAGPGPSQTPAGSEPLPPVAAPGSAQADQPGWGSAPAQPPAQPPAGQYPQPAGEQYPQPPDQQYPPPPNQPYADRSGSTGQTAGAGMQPPVQRPAPPHEAPWQHAPAPEQFARQAPPVQAGQSAQPGVPGQPSQSGQPAQSGQPVQAAGPSIVAPGAPPPTGTVPTKKTRAWRRARPPKGTGPVPPPGAITPHPPSDPPRDPVPLTSTTLPPPPPDVVGAGAPVHTQANPPAADFEGEVPPLPGSLWRSRRRRRAVEVGAVGAIGVVGATGAVEAAPGAAGAQVPTPASGPGGPNAVTETAGVTGFVGPASSPGGPPPEGPPPAGAQPAGAQRPGFSEATAPSWTGAASSTATSAPPFAPAAPSGGPPPPPAAGPQAAFYAPPAPPPGSPGPAGTVEEAVPDVAPSDPDTLLPPVPAPTTQAPQRERNMPLVFVLVAILVVVLGAIVFLAVRKHNSTTETTQAAVTSPSVAAVDSALATSINLRLTDLPAGWAVAAPAARAVRPPVAPASAQVQANRALASCLGVDVPTVAGLFGGSALPGQTASVRSPTFALGSDPNIQMYSATTTLSSSAQVQALARPFDNPNFANCYGLYQNALVSAAVPGATAQVQTVQLSAPAGVRSFGYLTTLTIPSQGSEVVGQAFMLGGRIESRLQPSTNGPPVPSDSFNPAYDAVSGRISRALNN